MSRPPALRAVNEVTPDVLAMCAAEFGFELYAADPFQTIRASLKKS